MKNLIRLFSAALLAPLLSACTAENVQTAEPALANDAPRLVFTDNFERSSKTDLGPDYDVGEKHFQGPNPSLKIKDGALHIYTPPDADHSTTFRHDVKEVFDNGEVRLRFQLTDVKDNLGVNFADLDLKSVHAGHLFSIRINSKRLEINDLKTGRMALTHYTLKRSPDGTDKRTKAMKKLTASKTKHFPYETSLNEWHEVRIKVMDGEMSVYIDENFAGRFASEGMKHPTKRHVRFPTPKRAIIDDFRVYKY